MIIEHLQLDASEAAQLADIAAELRPADRPASSLSRIRTLSRLACPSVIDLMNRLRSPDASLCAASIAGLDTSSLSTLRTPVTFGQYNSASAIRRLHGLMLMLGALLGVPYNFSTQQRGNLILDVFPVPGRENDQLGSSSTCLLEWHNEDAHHPMRADFSVLMCIRNDQRAATRYAAAAELDLRGDVELELRRQQFAIIPDESHSYSYNMATSGDATQPATIFSHYQRMRSAPPRIPVITGESSDPMIRVDFPYMPPHLHTAEALSALSSLKLAIDRAGQSIILQSGDLFVFDNRRGVHAREGFRASYDGTDRWLKRLNVLRDSTLCEAPQHTRTEVRTL